LVNRLTLYTDIAGRLSRSIAGSARVTAAAVVIETVRAEAVAKKLPAQLPKWKQCTCEGARTVVDLLSAEAVAVGVYSVNKDVPAWEQFWRDSEPLQAGIRAQDGRPAGFAKPAVVLAFQLIATASAMATGHALRIGSKNRIQDYRGRDLIERTIISDSDIAGEETLEVYRKLWARADGAQPRLEAAGIRFTTAQVSVTTEQEQPLLLLADYAAGVAHAAMITDPGRIPLPLPASAALEELARLERSGKLAFYNANFESTYKQVFGPVMDLVSE
jgi:hypothetical protein